MIARIAGTLLATETNAVVLDADGVGYRVFTTTASIASVAGSGDRHCTLWTHLVVRENALELFGFTDHAELEFFTLLISVSGIGPKSALAILNLAPVSTIKQAVATGDAAYLTKVGGIGKKNAQKIVLELKDKLGLSEIDAMPSQDAETLEALEALGYPLHGAREALKRIPPEATTLEARIKFALRELGNS